jgi:hypothetical protein
MTRYIVAKDVYPRRGVVQPDRSWQVYVTAAALLIGNVMAFLHWLL